MYQIMNESYSYMDDIFIFDPNHKITECKFYISSFCGINKVYMNMNIAIIIL